MGVWLRELGVPTGVWLSAVSSLFDYLCEKQRVTNLNPVDGVKRPATSSGEGATPHHQRMKTHRTSSIALTRPP